MVKILRFLFLKWFNKQYKTYSYKLIKLRLENEKYLVHVFKKALQRSVNLNFENEIFWLNRFCLGIMLQYSNKIHVSLFFLFAKLHDD